MTKILIIEDEKILAEMYQEQFSRAGYEVAVAFGVKDGMRLAKESKPNLILLDILLPEENGISFLEKVKQDPEISLIPIVAFSNYDDPETKKEAFSLGVRDYLIKTSYTPKEIVEKVKEYLK